ncbi:glycerol kinase [Ascoidea rubescens DSM 1968]|uniref:glycerol kinase n=1 Tax=Ascoidea rubescens DSM 1968 TaxID=1344418 RepID=A0A1D2V8Z4_9ASCO|nr:glycerol kinase [Ascoidea rubescens DSM 1968]ODV57987.1 glycerol kinase [Ascoidea rubescens DSM 1968]
MSIPVILSIDVGTTSTRAIIFDRNANEIANHQIEYSTSSNCAQDENTPTDAIKLKPDFSRGSGFESFLSAEGVEIKQSSLVEIEQNMNYKAAPTLIFPKAGWVEINPIKILENVVQCVSRVVELLEKKNHLISNSKFKNQKPFRILGIGVTNMRETTLVWSRNTGCPLYSGIVWSDTRTSHIVDSFINSCRPEKLLDLKQKTGLVPSTYFSSSKLKWLIDNAPQVKQIYNSSKNNNTTDISSVDKIMFGTIDTWLIYNFTKDHNYLTDVTNASRTMFMNLETNMFDNSLIELWNIDHRNIVFPKITSCSENFGFFTLPNFEKFGSKHFKLSTDATQLIEKHLSNVQICGSIGDQSSSLVGLTCFELNNSKCTYGTGSFILYNTGKQKIISSNGLLTTVGYWFPQISGQPTYALEGSVAVAGSVVQWLRDNLRLIEKSSDIGKLASQAADTAGVVFVPCFSGLFSPYWDPKARGSIFGLTQYTNSSHICKAAIIGICQQIRSVINSMQADFKSAENAVITNSLLRVDGGMSKSDEVLQMQADCLGDKIVIERSTTSESTALGAAIAAGLSFQDSSLRLWKDLDDVRSATNQATKTLSKNSANSKREFHCQMSEDQRQREWELWEKGVKRAMNWMD